MEETVACSEGSRILYTQTCAGFGKNDKGREMIRERFSGDLKDAIKAKDAQRVSTLRLICAAVKDRDIAERTGDNSSGCSDAEILAIV